jgi:hydrogenase maturation protein HypF
MTLSPTSARLRATVQGAVQGVGFRPFVYRLATEAGLTGWVNNSPQGVCIEVEGPRGDLDGFLARLPQETPPQARIGRLESVFLAPAGYEAFTIRPSETGGPRSTLILPDLATCPDCRAEILDPQARRYRYPFTNCTNCGPRFTIIEALPYDRPNTTMRDFPLCPACRAEYENPADRRFHAQPIACPICGPRLELWNPAGLLAAGGDTALRAAGMAIRAGAIVAIKGLGGFQLLADARNDAAVRTLRARKAREEKPFALMVPTLEDARAICRVSPAEARLLTSSAAPIVLLRGRPENPAHIAPAVAPGTPYLGVMLPYTPLHHLLMHDLGFPIVATSGNRADEPICTDEHDAITRLAGLADCFLVHNRPIARHADDSVACVVLEREMLLRRARGYAPLPIPLAEAGPPLLAVGGHLKNSVALASGAQVFISQHIGDMETAPAYSAFEQVIADLTRLYETRPAAVACDAHPDYASTHYAERLGLPVVPVQHHVAHVMSVIAEHRLGGPVLGVAWDGTGYGLDGTIWGGEFFRIGAGGWERVAHWRPFGLPGGERAIRQPWRTAIGLLYELMGDAVWAQDDLAPLRACPLADRAIFPTMLRRGLNTPRTSSAGRLFDAVAALTGLRDTASFEGQAAMALEYAADGLVNTDRYPIEIQAPAGGSGPLVLDWAPMIEAILRDVRAGVPVPNIAVAFQNTMVAAIEMVARRVGINGVVLSGGCFQNRYLLEHTVRGLTAAGFRPAWPQRLPPNDGGLAPGQILAALRFGGLVHPVIQPVIQEAPHVSRSAW